MRKYAHDLQDENLAKLSAGDLIAQEAKYHAKCLTNLYNRASAKVSQDQDVAMLGIAESFLKASHVTRTHHAHQVTACALCILLKKAYGGYVANNSEESTDTFSTWCERQKAESPQFMYWHTSLKLKLLSFTFV